MSAGDALRAIADGLDAEPVGSRAGQQQDADLRLEALRLAHGDVDQARKLARFLIEGK